MALERDLSRLGDLLGLRGGPLARVLVRGGLVDVAETGEVVGRYKCDETGEVVVVGKYDETGRSVTESSDQQ